MPTYAICRILGNELPPRDLPGSRLTVFDYILENEFLDEECQRVWILNRITDRKLAETIKCKLDSAGERFVELGIDWDAYLRASTRVERINVLIGINHARNEAFKLGAKLARYVFILDGDCFFNHQTWAAAKDAITRDQLLHPERQYYALPSKRVFLGEGNALDLTNSTLEEPMLLIRNDAQQLFDEKAAFSVNSKVSLLATLGLRVDRDNWYPLNSEGPCLVVGSVLHLNTGTHNVETDGWVRYIQRRESINRLIKTANRITAENLLKRSTKRFLLFTLRSSLLTAVDSADLMVKKCWLKVKLVLRKHFVR